MSASKDNGGHYIVSAETFEVMAFEEEAKKAIVLTEDLFHQGKPTFSINERTDTTQGVLYFLELYPYSAHSTLEEAIEQSKLSLQGEAA